MTNGLPTGELLPQIPGIQSGDLALDLILHDLAEGLRHNTEATGAAIALRRGTALLCRAAAGSTVPDLGAEINVHSGLTGACVREKKLQWCSDTEIDNRVDAAAARALGVRSILVCPLLANGEIAGVVELFAAQPHVFGEREVSALRETAAGILACLHKAGIYEEAPATTSASPAPEKASKLPGFERSLRVLRERDRTTRVLRAIAVSLAVLLCVLLGLRWGRSTKKATIARATTAPLPADPDAGSATNNSDAYRLDVQGTKPSAATGRTRAVPRAAAIIAHDTTGPAITKPDSGETAVSENDSDVRSRLNSNQERPPEAAAKSRVQVTPLADKELAEIGSAPARVLPSTLNAVVAPPAVNLPPPPISKGVEEGRLLRSVQPKYPPDAVRRGLQGLVVLHAVISKDGSIRDVKSVRGDSLLAQAAIEAVRQWRYQPYKLDGSAVDMPIDITINFNLPK